MKTVNRVQLMGFLGADPAIYAMPSGTLIARFSMATHYTYHDKRVKSAHVTKKATEWHSVVLLGSQAILGERFLQKGTCVYVEGSLKTREWDDGNHENKNRENKLYEKRRTTEIVASDLIVVYGGKPEMMPSVPIQQKANHTSHGKQANPIERSARVVQ